LYAALYGHWNYEFGAGRCANSREVATEFADIANQSRDTAAIMMACSALAGSLVFGGELTSGQREAIRAIEHYDESKHASIYMDLGEDPCVNALVQLSFALTMMGFPIQASNNVQRSIDLAKRLGHATTEVFAHTAKFMILAFAGEFESSKTKSASVMKIANEFDIDWYGGVAKTFNAWAISELGGTQSTEEDIQQGMSTCAAGGSALLDSIFLYALARSQQKSGRLQEAMNSVVRSIEFVEKSKEQFWAAELYRLKGEFHLSSDRNLAENYFIQALNLASSQQAKIHELRAATSLARLWHDRGETERGRELLAPIYDWFTEGLDTPYLRQAKALLDELG
jgi:predicted ATPase